MAEPGFWFLQTRHTIRDVEVVEVWFRDTFVATICPAEPADPPMLTVTSKYIDPDGIAVEKTPPPTVVIRFDMTKG